MRFALGSLACLILVTSIGHANGKPDPLTWTWKMNLSGSSGSLPKEETLVIKIEDGVHHYAVDVVDNDGSVRKSENHNKYIEGPFQATTNRLTGKTNNEIMMVRVDDR